MLSDIPIQKEIHIENSLISVVMPSYNMAEYITDAIDSVFGQTYKNIELIVVDDGSTDNTKEVVKKYARLQTIDHRPQTIRYEYQENRGVSVARNTGIKASQGEFIAFLDADDIWLPEKLEHQIKFMDSDKVGIVGCGIYIINEKGEISDNCIKKNYPNKSLLLKALYVKNVVAGSASGALVPKKCFDVIGMFDENLRSSEDWDMWLRIAQRYDVIFVEKPLVKIRIRTNSLCSPSNAQKMFDSGLIVLGKLFQYTKTNVFLRRKSYSYRYFSAAIAYKENGDFREAEKYLLKCFIFHPLSCCALPHLSLFLHVIFGHRICNTTKQIRNCIRERGIVYLLQRIIDKFTKFIIEKRTVVIYKRDLHHIAPQEIILSMVGKIDLIICDKLSSCDISHMRQIAETSELSQDEIEGRFRNGDICFLVTDEKGMLVHFLWVCFKKRYIEYVDYLLKLKENEASVYNGYTFEKYRGFSIYPWVLINVQKFLKTKGIQNVYGDININNIASTRGAEKAGFELIAKIKFVSVFRVIKFKKRIESAENNEYES